jgi:hypothetical protein
MARKSVFRTALDAVKRINDLEQLQEVQAAVEQRIADLEQQAREWQPPAAAVEVRTTPRGHYALEFVRCGKERCRCVSGPGHGPYWYHYRSVGNGKYSKTYVGRERPEEAKS